MLSKFLKKALKRLGGVMRKSLPILLLLTLLFPLFAQPIQAFYTPNASYPFQFWNAVFRTEEMNLQSFVYEAFKATLMSALTMIKGCPTCPKGQATWGAMGTVTSLIAFTYTSPPASGVEYLAYLGEKLDLVPSAHAQVGGGFARLLLLLPIWRAFRDISYVFFVIILVLVGFAIMFRVKISPQAVITIQSALPRIILVLILITFSYAVVGLLVDLMMVASNLIIFTFKNIIENSPNLVGSLGQLITLPLELSAPTTNDFTLLFITLMVGLPPIAIIWLFMIIMIAAASGVTIISGGNPLALVLLGGVVLIALLIALVFLWALVKVLWTLLKAYVNVVLALIFSPFILLMGVLPGSQAISGWFKNLLANLAVFPTILTMSFLAGYLTFVAISINNAVATALVTYLLTAEDPTASFENILNNISSLFTSALGTITTMIILFFVAIGIILLAPKAADMIKALIAGQPFGYGTAITAAAVAPIARSLQLIDFTGKARQRFQAAPIKQQLPSAPQAPATPRAAGPAP